MNVPVFKIQPPFEIPEPKTIVVESTQIQCRQTVFLNFDDLVWPHVSVATLVPVEVRNYLMDFGNEDEGLE